MSDAATPPPSFEAITVFDIQRECDAYGCSAPTEVALVAQFAGGGIAMRWVCAEHEAGAIPPGCIKVVNSRAPRPGELN